ncbi:MAG: hypothetical protein R3344_11310 [Acidobacteriota bacterium]|nr:hypothetical protein [Acidobacteriota bacterium]
MTVRRKRRRADLSREALERATAGPEPEIGALLDAVPHVVDEARRRRAAVEARDAVTASVPLAWKVIPRLAAAAVVLVLVCAGLILVNGADDGQDLDDVAFGAEIGSDLLIETVVGAENGDG